MFGKITSLEDKLPKRSKMALDSVQPGSISRGEHEFYVVLGGPLFHFFMLMRGKVIQDKVEALAMVKPSAQHLKETKKVLVPLRLGDMSVKLVGLQVQRGQQMLHAVRAIIGCPKPGWSPLRKPAFALVRLKRQRAKFIHANYTPVFWRILNSFFSHI